MMGDGPAPPTSPPAMSPMGLLLRNPEDVGLRSRMEQAVIAIRKNSVKPINTLKAFIPKIKEFEEFCAQCYPDDPYKYNMTAEKAYKYMFYHSFRNKKVRGGRREGASASGFNKALYDEMIAVFGVTPGREVVYPSPADPIGVATFTLYKAVLKFIHAEQEARRVCSLPWSHVWLNPCNELYKHVKERTPLMKQLTYKEKVTHRTVESLNL
jgi:hypothetical protein